MTPSTLNAASTHQPLVLRGISSMATKLVLSELSQIYFEKFSVRLEIESVGGVEAVKRIQNKENYDLVLLNSDAIDRLISEGHLLPNSRQDWVESEIAAAVPTGLKHPDLSNTLAVKNAILSSTSLSYSTGPSGVYLEKLFDAWGIAEQVKACLVVPPPGTPVGSLVASGRASLGFQQLSELISIPGIEVVGTLPSDIAYITIFSSGIPTNLSHEATRLQSVKNFVKFLTSQDVETVKALNGMKGIRSSLTNK
jgi:molybdate transport system substrate-binding protein